MMPANENKRTGVNIAPPKRCTFCITPFKALPPSFYVFQPDVFAFVALFQLTKNFFSIFCGLLLHMFTFKFFAHFLYLRTQFHKKMFKFLSNISRNLNIFTIIRTSLFSFHIRPLRYSHSRTGTAPASFTNGCTSVSLFTFRYSIYLIHKISITLK